MIEDINGWHSVKARTLWACPECKAITPIIFWEECSPVCEDCGTHDGRRCPNCDEEFDHVWGAGLLEEYMAGLGENLAKKLTEEDKYFIKELVYQKHQYDKVI